MTDHFSMTSRHRALAAVAFLGASFSPAPSADVSRACAKCPEMATIPAGSFPMGKMINYGYGDMDGPTHAVTLAKPFELSVHEVTLGEFRAFAKATGYVSEKKCNIYDKSTTWFIDPKRNWAQPGFPQEESHPVVCVSWLDTQAYVEWLNRETGQNYRLPSEAEWEYAAYSANLGNTVNGGSITHDIANIGKQECCGGETGGKDKWIWTAPVGSFPADKFGVRDQRGNVWEWQDDCYHVNYEGAPVDGSSRATCPTAGFHVVRGGSYGDASEYIGERFRLRGPEDQAYFTVGFRLARSIDAPAATGSGEALSRPVAAMFDATRRRDVKALADTLSTSVEPEIVYYWGETVTGRDTILQWHKEWFAEAGWMLAPEKAGRVLAGSDLATLAYTIEYIKNPQRKFHILMTLTVVPEGAAWKVARIQQTLLEGPQ